MNVSYYPIPNKKFNSKSNASLRASNPNIKDTSKSARIYPVNRKNQQDDLIASLQKQIYYLELETKLMKDKELETKNKAGGYEILFHDGVPLNENFLALKTKYKNELDDSEKSILNLTNYIKNTENENKNLLLKIEQTNKNYFDLIQKYNASQEDYANKLFDANQKVFNEDNTMVTLNNEKTRLSKDLSKFTSENLRHNRTIEKNSLFKDDPNEKNEKVRRLAEDKYLDINRKAEESLLEKEELEKKQIGNQFLKEVENENFKLLQQINKLDQNSHMLQAKIAELQNNQIINKKYLIDEIKLRDVHLKENTKYNEELDNLSKLNEEKLREKVKECEDRQILILKNSSNSAEIKMGLLLNMYKDAEEKARALLEEKNNLLSKLNELKEEYNNNITNDTNIRNAIINTKSNINQLTGVIKNNEDELKDLTDENNKYRDDIEEYEKRNEDLKNQIIDLQKKIELNEMLKDVDINELKILSQNNAIVNKSINNLLTKWDKVEAKMSNNKEKEKEN